ncbi:hypothetical protein G4B88_029174 [Cannabis sativa]|uniref:Uncharacterized protein n=1 Tax=Cannabis sativa TaxID=3483 RepID=A0A7J6F0F3_CANSA|nr:hypothetical protein G4B88_029174 [Cannabis sativa]
MEFTLLRVCIKVGNHDDDNLGPFEITTRWTVVMEYMISPWKPEMVITGTSTMGINPKTGKFCTHVVTSYASLSKTYRLKSETLFI